MTKDKETYQLQLSPEPSSAENCTTYAPKRKNSTPKKKKVIITAAVCLFLLILTIVLIAIFVLQNNKNKNLDNSNNNLNNLNNNETSSGDDDPEHRVVSAGLLNKPSEKKPPSPIVREREKLNPPNPVVRQPPSASELKFFKNGAVCSDSEVCSGIGRDIFNMGGNVVDATIATMFCTGVTVSQSMGIGGGFIMNIYKHNEKKAYTLDAREYAPLAGNSEMFINDTNKSIHGPLSIAVPGEVAGYYAAWKRFGNLEWRDLIEPTVQVCDDGFFMTRHMQDAISFVTTIKNDKNMRNYFVNKSSDQFYTEGALIRPEKLCDTLKLISENGGEDFYNGIVAEMLVKDFQDAKSIITKEDLENYQVNWYDSVPIVINNDILHLVPFPGSGLFVGFILNILKGYNITENHIKTIESETLFYHRLVEAFKFAFAARSEFGDPKFVNITKLVADVLDPSLAEKLRHKIKDDETSNDPTFYNAEHFSKTNHGTSPLVVIAPNGDAVAVTSSINFYFGSTISGERTGIIFNNGMNDFSTPKTENLYGLKEAPANYIHGNKRSLSSMSPTIVTDKKGNVRLAMSAAGGSKIPTAMATALIRSLWFHEDIKKTVDEARIHHQLSPMEIQYEYGILDQVVEGLEKLGHKTTRYRERGSVICALAKNETGVYGNADFRKRGQVIGLDETDSESGQYI